MMSILNIEREVVVEAKKIKKRKKEDLDPDPDLKRKIRREKKKLNKYLLFHKNHPRKEEQ
jgi:hypothetical protein